MDSLKLLDCRQHLTELLYDRPYDVLLYVERARLYEKLGFPDLASGDAYKALLLTDEVQDESGDYHDQALDAFKTAVLNNDKRGTKEHATNGSICLNNGLDHGLQRDNQCQDLDINESIRACALQSYRLLARNLQKCGCLRTAFDFCLRGLHSNPHDHFLEDYQSEITESYRRIQVHQDALRDNVSFDLTGDLPEQGSVRRELYAWNIHEPDRFSSESISYLNSEMSQVAPKCRVHAVKLPLLTADGSVDSPKPETLQLGIFAEEDIAPGETVLHESSMLTANNRLHHPLCDACSSELPSLSSQDFFRCTECDDTVFCSDACLRNAMSKYHPAVCGKDLDTLGKDTDPKESANALYLLLLGRAIALAETQESHPLDLKETKYIWGDFIRPDSAYAHVSSASPFSAARHLPFSFAHNVLAPLHILGKMDIDIYKDLERYDFWIFNTLYAKFRGTASARLSCQDGRPEVCAVHPMWSLANHSCAPNVRWEWGAEIKFWARSGPEVVQWGGCKSEHGRIEKGEEILNHYCDVELPLRKRREWAVGTLGGMCLCKRCIWEEKLRIEVL
ncbi:hypothetical protein MMC06_003038 [Schaereria dolodes]|nr:hypothetical protein [Schaereria dolodes]